MQIAGLVALLLLVKAALAFSFNPLFKRVRRSLGEVSFMSSFNDMSTDGESSMPLYGSFHQVKSRDDSTENLQDYCEVVDEFGSVAYENFCDGEDDSEFRWIRVQKHPDACLNNINDKEDVIRKIAEVKKEQSRSGRADLYPRKWSPLGSKRLRLYKFLSTAISRICGRLLNGNAKDKQFSISAMQFNTLAEGLSCGPDVQPPFRIDANYKHRKHGKQDYGGFTEIPCPSVVLDFDLRRWRLLEVILGSDGSGPFDLIALEEVDRYRGFFAPVMQLFGYDGTFMPKPRSPGVRMGWYSDGCCLFWKKKCFEMISERRLEYDVGNQVLSVVTLRHLPSRRSVVAAVTHLKAQKKERNESVRYRQVEELLGHVEEVVSNARKRDAVDSIPVFIIGDFNADPPTQIAGKESSAVKRVLESGSSTASGRLAFLSAYEIDPPQEKFYTTWKTRGTNTPKRIIDYIFHSDNVECQANLRIPSADELEPSKLPGLRYPSDHVAIAAKFVI